MVKFCSKCISRNNPSKHPGYFFWYDDSEYICMFDQNKLIDCNIIQEELDIIASISSDSSFIEAMDNLKQKDIIEFNLKMSQFKSQVNKQKAVEESNVPKCPTCGSTNIEKISVGKKALGGAMFGIFSSNIRNTMHCKNCGAKW